MECPYTKCDHHTLSSYSDIDQSFSSYTIFIQIFDATLFGTWLNSSSGSVLSPLLFLIYVSDISDPKHYLNSKSQFVDDTGLWAGSKKAFLAANRLQRDLDVLAEWSTKWRIKLNPEKNKFIMFSRALKETANKPALFLYVVQLSYFPHVKFLGITFDHKLTFKTHSEDILERCQQKYHLMRMLVNQKWGPSLQTILKIYKQCVRPIFEYGEISTIPVSDTVITKLQKLQNSFIRLALRLLRYISTRLLHETLGLPFIKDRLLAVASHWPAMCPKNTPRSWILILQRNIWYKALLPD